MEQACNEIDLPWLEAGVSEDAMNGHIQVMLPGRTACYQCLPPLIVESGGVLRVLACVLPAPATSLTNMIYTTEI